MGTYNARSLFSDVAKTGIPSDQPEKIWKALGGYVEECLRMGKGLKIPSLGTFSSVKNAVRDSQPGLKRRIFNVAPPFARAYGVPNKKVGYDLLAPALEFNLSKLAYKASTDKDTAATILSAMIRCLGAAVASGQAVRLLLDPVGEYVVQRRDVSFRFAGHSSSSSLQTSNGAANGPPSASALIESYSMVSPMATRRPPSSLEKATDGGEGGANTDTSLFGNSNSSRKNNNNNSGRNSQLNSSRLNGPEEDGRRSGSGYDATNFPHDMSLRGAAHSAEGDDQATGRYTNVVGATQFVGANRAALEGPAVAAAAERVHDSQPPPQFGNAASSSSSSSSWVQPETLAVFPRMSAPTSMPRFMSSRSNTNVVEKNLAGAFNRFEQHLALQQAQGLAEAADMAARKKRTQQLFVERLGRDAAQKADLLATLSQQRAFHSANASAERQAFLASKPSPESVSRTYPVDPVVDPQLEHYVKSTLRGALDEQVALKTAAAQDDKHQDLARDRFVLDCVRREAAVDHAAALSAKQQQASELGEIWANQRRLARAGRELAYGAKLH